MSGADAFVIDALRTPIGRIGGALSGMRADDLAAHAVRALLERTGVPADQIDEVILGCANQAGEDNRNVARMAALLAGMPVSVPGVTVNRLCGSGLQAVADAGRMVATGDADLVIAGGVEHMTRAPWVMGKPDSAFARGPQTLFDTTLGWRFVNPRMTELHETIPLGETAERVAQRENVTREDQDAFAATSQERAEAAQKAGRFDAELAAITFPPSKDGKSVVFATDEHPRAGTTAASLAKLKPAFQSNGTVTAGNSSGLNDGSAALLIASAAAVKRLNLVPMARIVASAAAGVEVSLMGLGPIPATRKAWAKAGLSANDMDVVELNEAFAAQALPCIRHLELDPTRVNPNGGAIALGHPLGASGARLAGTLVHELRRSQGRYGLASMCIGVGQGISLIVERV